MTEYEEEAAHRLSALAGELRVVMSRIRRRARETRPRGLSSSQLLALSRLEREGATTVTALARAEGMRPQSMGTNIAVLEQAGLISRSQDPGDGRQSLISVTAEARKMIAAYRVAREDWLFRAMQTKLTPAEQGILALSVDILRRLAEEAEA